MEIENTLRPNITKSNARFRGTTESTKYFNFIQEMLHDITLLSRVIDTNDMTKERGQTDYIKNNLSLYFSGHGNQIYANVPTASTLFGIDGSVLDSMDFSKTEWGAYGGCIKTAGTLESPGTNDPCGVAYTLGVQEGQVIYIRMFVKPVSGIADFFTIGSMNVNQGEGSTKTFKIPAAGIYIGHYIQCRHKETIDINIDVNRLAQTAYAGKVEISDASITYIDMHDYHLQPLNTAVKANISVLEQEIHNIIDNM